MQSPPCRENAISCEAAAPPPPPSAAHLSTRLRASHAIDGFDCRAIDNAALHEHLRPPLARALPGHAGES